MKTATAITLALVTTACTGCAMSTPTQAYAASSPQAERYSALRRQMSALITRGMKKHQVTGMSVALLDGGELVWAQGYGYADKDARRLADAQTIYKVGSITKVFTGTAIMQLVEQGRLDLDAPIQRYIPELKVRYRTPTEQAITLRRIMSHTSGLPVDHMQGMFNRHPEPYARAIDYLNGSYAAYAPGTIATYSNLGTDLLGVVIERVSGEPYADYMQRHILAPAGMQHSTLDDRQVDRGRMSLSYLRNKHHEEYPLRSVPAGNLHSSVLDMARFAAVALHQGQPLLTPAAFDEMTRNQTTHARYDSGMAFGLNWLLQRPGLDYLGPVIWHNGGTINFMSSLVVLPKQGLAVVVLSNSARSIEFVEQTANDILKAAAQAKSGIEPPAQAPRPALATVPADIAQATVGSYATLLGPVRIVQYGDNLRARLAGRVLQLRYHSDGWFSLRYKLFGLIPIPVRELDAVRIRITEVDGNRIMLAEEQGATYIGGQAYQPEPLSDLWRSRLGTYKADYLKDDYPWIDKVHVAEQDGFLVLTASFDKLGATNLTLHPLDDDMAVIAGLGRGMQETLTASGEGASTILTYSGFRLIKVK